MRNRRVPTAHELQAAYQTARVLHSPRTNLADARESFMGVPNGGRFGRDDFERGTGLLADANLIELDADAIVISESIGVVADVGETAAVEILLRILLAESPPPWLRVAAGGNRLDETRVPDEEMAVLSELLTEPERREAILLHAGRRFDQKRLAELGRAGEEAVVDACRAQLRDAERPDLADRVARVSERSDELGYDVTAPKLDESGWRRLEVKATQRLRWRGEVFLSRNEFDVGMADTDWALVVCEVDAQGDVTIAGWCRAPVFKEMMPQDRHFHGRWVRTSLLHTERLLEPGLPPA